MKKVLEYKKKVLPLYSETVTTALLSRNNKSVKTIWIMIYEQANALGNLLGYLKESEVIDLYNEVFKGGKKIYKVENLNSSSTSLISRLK